MIYLGGCSVLCKEVFAKILSMGYKMQLKPLKLEGNIEELRQKGNQLFCGNFMIEGLISNLKKFYKVFFMIFVHSAHYSSRLRVTQNE